jgi:thioredoxin reductase (NADPH)
LNSMKSKAAKEFDVIIIGGGVAGISAAVWCDELGLKALLLESATELGGQLLWTYNAIKNYLGIEAENGRELRDIFLKQTGRRNFLLKTKCKVVEVDVKNKTVLLADGESFAARALVIAVGISRRKLGIKGEADFERRGIIESGKRDAALIEGKRVVIVGGGDAALENALILSETASEIILVHRRAEFRARPEFIKQVLKNKKIQILTETAVKKISGNERLERLGLQNLKTGNIFHLPVDALLIRVGVEPATNLFQGKLDLDKDGFIKIDSHCETSTKDIFAVGDVANPLSLTISSAAGMGTTSIKTVYQRLKN